MHVVHILRISLPESPFSETNNVLDFRRYSQSDYLLDVLPVLYLDVIAEPFFPRPRIWVMFWLFGRVRQF